MPTVDNRHWLNKRFKNKHFLNEKQKVFISSLRVCVSLSVNNSTSALRQEVRIVCLWSCDAGTVKLRLWQSGMQWVWMPRDISGWYVRGPPTSLLMNYGASWQEQFNPASMTGKFRPMITSPVVTAYLTAQSMLPRLNIMCMCVCVWKQC